MPFRVESAGRTHTGLVRDRNEDALLIDNELRLWVVCDGMGGHRGGQVASQLAVATIADSLRSGVPAGDRPDPLASAIAAANRAVYLRGRSDRELFNMGTTVVAIRLENNVLHLCHVGDSRIYRWRQGDFQQLTRDHSLVNLYADNPGLAAKFGPAGSNVIVRALGLREEVEIDHQRQRIEHGDMYLLCCDGLTDMVDDWILKEVMADGAVGAVDECADTLIRAALNNGGVDNVTVVVLRLFEITAT